MSAPAVGTIRERSAFRALRRTDRRAASGPVTVAYVRGPDGAHGAFPQVAYAIGRRTGGAVMRNRIRRRLRAVVRDLAGELAPGAYLLGAGPSAAVVPHAELVRAVRDAMIRAGAAREAKAGEA